MKADEKVTFFIDFNHIGQFRFNLISFMDNLVNEYHRYEPYMRKGATQFMNDIGH